MATNRILQLLRSNQVYESKSAAITAVSALTGADGEIRLARYNAAAAGEDEVIKSLLCVYHASPSLPTGKSSGWTFIEDASQGGSDISALQTELDNLEAQVGQDGASNTYNSGVTDSSDAEKVLGGDPTGTNPSTPSNLSGAVANMATYVGALDKAADAQNGQVVTTVTQVDGLVSETKANVKDLQLGGYSKDASANLPIASTDTVNAAFSKVENAIAKNTVSSTDKTVTIDTTGSTTDLSVNIDGTTLVKNSTTGVISSDLKILKETTNLDANVREQYKLVYGSSTTAIGDTIKVYKDSALNNVYIGHVDDALTNADAQGESADTAVTNGTGSEALCFIYHLENDKYKLETVNVESFLQESEFGDGLQVVNNEVSVLIDPTSEKDSQSTPVDFLTVSSNGVKVQGIKDEIDRKIAAQGITAAGDSVYIAAAVDANDNKKINVTGTYGAFNTPTAANNALSATTNGIAKAEDVATAVNTVVGNLDGSATATAASGNVYTVLTSVTETDGVIAKGGEVTLAAVAKTGTAADVSVVDANSKLTATNVEDALEEIVDKADASLNSVSSGNGAISVGTKDGNKNQAISLVIAPHTAATDQAPATEANDMLSVTASGLSLSNVWDCGTY